MPTRDETTEPHRRPARLLTADGHDYLDAWCHLAEARRLFRLDRMHAVEVVDEPRAGARRCARATSPTGLFQPGPEDLVAVLHLAPAARWVADYYPVDAARSSATAGWRSTLRVGDPRWLVRLVLRLAPAVTVVEPPGLRDEVARTAQAALALYDAETPGRAMCTTLLRATA